MAKENKRKKGPENFCVALQHIDPPSSNVSSVRQQFGTRT